MVNYWSCAAESPASAADDLMEDYPIPALPVGAVGLPRSCLAVDQYWHSEGRDLLWLPVDGL